MYPIIFLTQVEMKARWDKNLCYNCDDVYSFEHRCAKIQLYMLKDEEEGDEEEVENTENVVDRGGKLIDVQDPEDSANKEISGSDLVSPIKLNLPELQGDEPEHEPETRSLVKEIKPPDSEIATYLVKSQEATIEATSEAKNTKPWPKPDPNRNSESTLSYPNPIFPPLQTQSFHAVNQTIAAFLNANRPEPWPNKPSINTNPNRPNPWPNKLPTLTYFIRPKPWPGDHPICTVPKPITGSNETKKFGKQTRRRPYQFHPRFRTKSDGQLNIFPVTNHARQRNQHRFWSTHSRADAIDLLIAIHRTSWTATTTTTSFPDVNRLRSRPESQLMVLLVFDPGDFHSKEEEGKISFDFNGDLGHFGRFFEGDRRRIEASGRRFSERRRIGNEEEFTRLIVEDPNDGRSPLILIYQFRNYCNNYPRTSVVAALIYRRRGKLRSKLRFTRVKKRLGISEINWEFRKFTSRDFCWSKKKKNWGFFSNDRLLFCEGRRIGCRFYGDLRVGEERVRKWGVV